MIWLLALVAGVTANQCTDDLEAIVVNSAWQEMKTGIDKANEDAIDQMATCLNSDSACTRTVTLKSGVDAERKTCISNVPSTKHHTVANTVMCRDRISLKYGPNSVDLHMFICAPSSCDPKYVGDFVGCALTTGMKNISSNVVCASEFIYCDFCNGCFIDQTAYWLKVSSTIALVLYIAVASVILGFLAGLVLYFVLRKKIIKRQTSPEEWKQKILDFYKEHNPEKLEDRSTLDILFSKYKGQERPLYNMICKKYAARNTTLAAETEMPAHSAVAEAAIGASTGTTPLLQS